MPSVEFVVDDNYHHLEMLYNCPVTPLSQFTPSKKGILIAIANPSVRANFAKQLSGSDFLTFVHPSAKVGPGVELGEGSIVMQQVILTCDIRIGQHAQLNVNTTVGHDCQIGDFFTTAPAVNVSGTCKIGTSVYLGTQAAIRENLQICDDTTIGMGAMVTSDISKPGTYVGIPAKLIEKC